MPKIDIIYQTAGWDLHQATLELANGQIDFVEPDAAPKTRAAAIILTAHGQKRTVEVDAAEHDITTLPTNTLKAVMDFVAAETLELRHLAHRSEQQRARIERAFDFARKQHRGQVRKFSQLPFITHPLSVRNRAITLWPELPVVMEMALLLHDVVEDTDATYKQLRWRFGRPVERAVRWLTNTTTKEDGARTLRKAIERKRIALAPPDVQQAKCSDIADNVPDIAAETPAFARTYLPEKMRQLLIMDERVKATSLYRHALSVVTTHAKKGNIPLPTHAALPLPAHTVGKVLAVTSQMLPRMLPDQPESLAVYQSKMNTIRAGLEQSPEVVEQVLYGLCEILHLHAERVAQQGGLSDPDGSCDLTIEFSQDEAFMLLYNHKLTRKQLAEFDPDTSKPIHDERVLPLCLRDALRMHFKLQLD